jgi:hypothetical protein
LFTNERRQAGAVAEPIATKSRFGPTMGGNPGVFTQNADDRPHGGARAMSRFARVVEGWTFERQL